MGDMQILELSVRYTDAVLAAALPLLYTAASGTGRSEAPK
ncbi:hypothetical protein DSUL_20536 [Desulfovibrionales bacterium]